MPDIVKPSSSLLNRMHHVNLPKLVSYLIGACSILATQLEKIIPSNRNNRIAIKYARKPTQSLVVDVLSRDNDVYYVSQYTQ